MSIASDALLREVMAIARAAGEVIMAVYAEDFAVRAKADASPVTQADERAEALILPRLATLSPQVPIVSEEATANGHTPEVGDRFWLVDPLDGTKEFISRNGEFTVNIALIEQRRPTLGVVFAPALGALYAGYEGGGARLIDGGGERVIACREVPAAGMTVVASRSHGDAEQLRQFLGTSKVAEQVSVGSSLKFCLVASARADLYPRLGRTMEWDTAAGDAVLRAAGGRVTDVGGHLLPYGKRGFENPHFVARGRERH